MYRRRGTDEDSSELVSEEAQESEDELEGDYTARIKEEKHNVPRPLSMLKLRIVAKSNSPKSKLLAWWITIGLLGFIAFIFVLVPLLIERGKRRGCSDFLQNQYGPVREQPELPFFFQRDSGNFEVCHEGSSVLSGILGVKRSLSSEVKVNTFSDTNGSLLNIAKVPGQERNCIRIAWVGASSRHSPLQDCYRIVPDMHWFGAYEQKHQDWPLSFNFTEPFTDVPFLPTDLTSIANGVFGSVLHPLWLSSAGVGLLVDKDIPLRISMNSTTMCLSAQPSQLDCGSKVSVDTSLNYTICAFDTLAAAAKFFLNSSNMISRPTSVPEEYLFQEPLWTASVESGGTQFTQEMIKVCENILSSNLSFSQIELGEVNTFSIEDSLEGLANSLCSTTNTSLWVHPYVDYSSTDFEIGLKNNFFLPGSNSGSIVSLVRWSESYGAVTNFFSASARNNFQLKLNGIKSMSQVSSLNFEGGHLNYLPTCAIIDVIQDNVSFVEEYIDFIANQSYSRQSSVKVGFYTQDKSIFVRLNRNFALDLSSGLSSILSTVLSVGLGGYSFVIPECSANFSSCQMGNSNCYELYIRWIQLNTFLPVMHLYHIPNLFNNHTLIQHIDLLASLHRNLNFTQYANEAIVTGYPIIRPLWWKGFDRNTWDISDQFYIGDDIMVAPMLDIFVRGRTVYFPDGTTYVINTISPVVVKSCPHGICHGGTHVYFPVHLYEVLYFKVV